jgi:CDP-diacylglycerol--serine O-phosphatidyltransferase
MRCEDTNLTKGIKSNFGRSMKKALPHILTLGNLLCGILSLRAIFNDEPFWAISFVFAAAVLDFFDGFVARALGVSGDLGKQLDSLADNVTFGAVPAVMLLSVNGFLHQLPTNILGWMLFGASLLVAALATLRLAIFNLDESQVSGFKGMPTPGNTLLISALYYAFFEISGSFFSALFQTDFLFLIVIIFIAIWQVLPIPLMALKFKTWQFKSNRWRYLFIVFSAVLFFAFFIEAIPIIILLYLLFSIAQNTSKAS